ncbi:MAG: hypothetical protein AAF416_15540 [Pseudomonadota bacterium]
MSRRPLMNLDVFAAIGMTFVLAMVATAALGDEPAEQQSQPGEQPEPRTGALAEAFELGMLVDCPDGVTLFYACPVTPVVRHGIRPAEGALIEAITELED